MNVTSIGIDLAKPALSELGGQIQFYEVQRLLQFPIRL